MTTSERRTQRVNYEQFRKNVKANDHKANKDAGFTAEGFQDLRDSDRVFNEICLVIDAETK